MRARSNRRWCLTDTRVTRMNGLGAPATPDLTLTVSPFSCAVVATGLASSAAYGGPAVEHIIALQVAGMASGTTFGTASLAPGSVSIAATGIATGAAYGAPTLSLRLLATGLAPAEVAAPSGGSAPACCAKRGIEVE